MYEWQVNDITLPHLMTSNHISITSHHHIGNIFDKSVMLHLHMIFMRVLVEENVKVYNKRRHWSLGLISPFAAVFSQVVCCN